jgi:Flp pilus assembly protein TadG
MKLHQKPLSVWGHPATRTGRRTGSAAVEFALVLPFFCMIILGMFELGRAVNVKNILSDAARKACRTGIKRDKGNTDIIGEVTNIMTDNGFTSTKFSPPAIGSISITVTDPNGVVLPDALDAPPGTVVSVQVSIPVSSTTWVPVVFLGSATNLESETVVMMKQ